MSKKITVLLLAAFVLTAVACESEIDGKTAAEVSEPVEEATPEEEATAEANAEAEAEVETRTLAFNPESSKIEWVGAKVTGDHNGGFNEWTGTATVDEENNLKSVEFVVDTTSIWSDNDQLTGHLKDADFFEVETYPEAKFVSRSIEEGVAEGAEGTHTVRGDMTIKDATRTIAFPVTAAVTDEAMTINSEFTIKRFDFNIEYKGMADDLIEDEVLMKLSFELPLTDEGTAVVAEETEEAVQ